MYATLSTGKSKTYLHIYIYTYICTHMYVYPSIYLSIYQSIHPSTHRSIYLSTCTYIHAYMHAYVHTCMHTYTHTYPHTGLKDMRSCIHTLIPASRACIYIYTCVDICMHAHTHMFRDLCTRVFFLGSGTCLYRAMYYLDELIRINILTAAGVGCLQVGFHGTGTPKTLFECTAGIA